MNKRWTIKTTLGLLVWAIALTVAAGLLWKADRNQTVTRAVQRLKGFWTTPQVTRTAVGLYQVPLGYNDPVFLETESGFQRIAQVIDRPTGLVPAQEAIHFRLYGDTSEYWQDGYLEIHQPARNLARVAEVMLTQERLAKIRDILEQAQQAHQQQIVAELSPLFRQALIELRPTLEAEFLASLKNHRPEMDALLEKYKQQIVQEKLLPVVETEVLPVVQRHAQPLMEEIGSDLWRRVSLWRFGWRYIYDKGMQPNEPLFNKEWQRFLNQEAIPAVRKRTSAIVAVQSAIIEELASNPNLRQVVRESLEELSNDEEAKGLVRTVLQDSLTRNDRVQKELQRFFQDPKTQQVLRRVGDRFEPYAVQIGQELFGTPDQVNREFALVLRHMILRKDQRWLIWRPGNPPGFPDGPTRTPDGQAIPMVWTTDISMPPFFQSTDDGLESSGTSTAVPTTGISPNGRTWPSLVPLHPPTSIGLNIHMLGLRNLSPNLLFNRINFVGQQLH